MTGDPISKKTLARLPLYLGYLREQKNGGQPYISATTIADALGLNQVQVRKDLALISNGGKPKVGYRISELEAHIERFLGYDNINSAVIVGAGHLGKALMSYVGFKQYGLEIIAAFDSDPSLWNTTFNGITVFPPEKMADIAERLKLHIGIITVPAPHAQEVCDRLVEAGVRAIWNFAPTVLRVPEGILVQNENMASSLALLCNHLAQRLNG